jgi:hypothetical protein
MLVDDDRLDFAANLDAVLASALVGVVGACAEPPEGLEPAFAIDDFVVLVLWPGDEPSDPGEGAERVGALGPCAAFRMVQRKPVGEQQDALFCKFDVHALP